MDPPEEPNKSLSFGFFKKQEAVQLKKSAIEENEEKVDNTKDFVLSLEGKELKSTKSDREKKKKTEYVIPLIQQNRWRKDNGDTESNSLDLQAAEEILKDSAKLNNEWEQKGSNEDTTRSIPLLMHNKIPDGFETDSKLDVALRPTAPNDADYDQIPIEHFGMAMLRGMGWNESRGVGKNGQVIAPVEAQVRPKGLGLGADRSNDKKNKDSKMTERKDESETLELKKGSCCVVTAGANKDLYGVVEGIDEDNSRVMVKLALNGKSCNLMQCNISLVSKKEYDKFSKYLNKQMADKYKKEEEEKLMYKDNAKHTEKQNGHHEKSHSHKRQHSDEEYYDDHLKHHKKDRGHSENSDRNSSRHKKHSKHKKSKHKKSHKSGKYDKEEETYSRSRKDKHSESSNSEYEDNVDNNSDQQRPWVQQDLRVRVVDKKFDNFYKEKVVIVDVPAPGICVCKSNDGKVLDGISQSSLETVIPRDDNSFVLIVSGPERGQVGQIMKRDKEKCLTLVQLLSDRDTVLRLGYDEVCEYVGNVHAREDY